MEILLPHSPSMSWRRLSGTVCRYSTFSMTNPTDWPGVAGVKPSVHQVRMFAATVIQRVCAAVSDSVRVSPLIFPLYCTVFLRKNVPPSFPRPLQTSSDHRRLGSCHRPGRPGTSACLSAHLPPEENQTVSEAPMWNISKHHTHYSTYYLTEMSDCVVICVGGGLLTAELIHWERLVSWGNFQGYWTHQLPHSHIRFWLWGGNWWGSEPANASSGEFSPNGPRELHFIPESSSGGAAGPGVHSLACFWPNSCNSCTYYSLRQVA